METKTATPNTARVTTRNSPELENTTLREILGIPDTAMDQAMGIAYQLYLTGRLPEAETVCKGLIACDHRYWWSHSLHASVLRRLGRCEDALAAVEEGLKYEPGQAKLSLMRAELLITIARNRSASAAPTAPNTATRLAADLAHGRTVQTALPSGL
jgi:predicted Zn-dependent protease